MVLPRLFVLPKRQGRDVKIGALLKGFSRDHPTPAIMKHTLPGIFVRCLSALSRRGTELFWKGCKAGRGDNMSCLETERQQLRGALPSGVVRLAPEIVPGQVDGFEGAIRAKRSCDSLGSDRLHARVRHTQSPVSYNKV